MSSKLTKEFNAQCQRCLKGKEEKVKLFRCSGCQSEHYCSRQCQREAWPKHKLLCQPKRELLASESALSAKMRSLRAFTTRHRPTLATLSMVGLRLRQDPGNGWREFVRVRVQERVGETRPERAWRALDVGVGSYDELPRDMVRDLLGQLREMGTFFAAKVQGVDGLFYVMMEDEDTGMRCPVPISYEKETLGAAPPGAEQIWKDKMMTVLNDGIVVRYY